MRNGDKGKYIFGIIKIPFKYAPANSFMLAVQKVLEAVIPTLKILVTAKFLDTAISIFNGKENINKIFMPLILLALLISFKWISEQFSKFIEIKLKIKLSEKLRVDIIEKRGRLKYKYIEDSDTWDLISRVSKDSEEKFKNAYNELLALISMIIKVGGLLLIIGSKVWWAAIFILAISVPLFYLSIKSGKANYEVSRKVTKFSRKYLYFDEILKDRESCSERTIFGFTKKINEKFYENYEACRKIEFKTNLKWFTKMKLGSIITALLSVIIVVVLLKPVSEGILSIGLFISIANAVFELVQMMSWTLTYLIDRLAANIEYLKDYYKFIELDEQEDALSIPKYEIDLKELEFKNVYFKYPNTDNYILKNISFKIQEGYHYSFVGVNGAGKTTLTKLITGLYENFEGEILINGKSIREYTLEELKGISTVVYQDFARYYITAKDNILLGNINNFKEEKRLDEAIKTVELEESFKLLPKGIETNLGKIKEDGVDISGGQWQRIGMARAIMSLAPLKILDEPTAALDPISESNVYEKFEEISRGGTTIFISHRLGSTKLADKIFVIEDGSIKEEGSHEELMNLGGTYKNMYESQRGWYI